MSPETGMMILGCILFFTVLFQNSQVVTLKILFLKFSMSQIILIILFTIIGFLTGLMFGKKGFKR